MAAINQGSHLNPGVSATLFEATWANGLENFKEETLETVDKIVSYVKAFVFFIPKAIFSPILNAIVLPLSSSLFFGVMLVTDFLKEMEKCFNHAWEEKKPALTFLDLNTWDTRLSETPEVLKSYDVEALKVKTPDGVTLSGHFFKHVDFDKPNSRIMLILGGNSELYKTGSQLSWLMKGLHDHADTPVSFLAFDYRGIGASKEGVGEVNAKSLVLDAGSFYQLAKGRLNGDESRIDVFGHSLGGTVALQLKSYYGNTKGNAFISRTFNNLEEESSFYLRKKFGESLGSLALIKILQLSSRLLGWEFDNESIVENIKDPTFVFYHKNDETVPYEQSLAKTVKEKFPDKDNYNIIEVKDKPAHVANNVTMPHLMTLDHLNLVDDATKTGLDVFLEAYKTS